MRELTTSNLTVLNEFQLQQIVGGSEPAKGSYAAGYAIGSWIREMYSIWSYGLTHLTDR